MDWHYIDPQSPENSPEELTQRVRQAWTNSGEEIPSQIFYSESDMYHCPGGVWLPRLLGVNPFHIACINIGEVTQRFDPRTNLPINCAQIDIHMRIDQVGSLWEYRIDLNFLDLDLWFDGVSDEASSLEEAMYEAETKGLTLASIFSATTGVIS